MSPTRTTRRPAFTLVELLVVIAIIGILASLTAVAVFRWVDQTRENNSEALIRAVNEVLQQHWRKVIEAAKKEAPPSQVMVLAGGDTDRAKLIWVKLRLTEAFPMSYHELYYNGLFYNHVTKSWVDLMFDFGANKTLRKYTTGYITAINKVPAANDPESESAACLLAALSVSRDGAAKLNLDMLPIPPVDSDGDGAKEIVDGWGHPVAFFRFPTLNADLQASNPDKAAPLTAADPLDWRKTSGATKYAMLTDPSWWGALPNKGLHPTYNMRQIVQEVCRFTLEDPANKANPRSFYTVPVIICAAPITRRSARRRRSMLR